MICWAMRLKRQAVTNATLLAPPAELLRRYPELGKLTERYTPASVPAGM